MVFRAGVTNNIGAHAQYGTVPSAFTSLDANKRTVIQNFGVFVTITTMCGHRKFFTPIIFTTFNTLGLPLLVSCRPNT